MKTLSKPQRQQNKWQKIRNQTNFGKLNLLFYKYYIY